MDDSTKEALLGIFCAAGIIFIWQFLLGYALSFVSFELGTGIKSLVLYNSLPIILIGFFLYKQLKLDRSFNISYFTTIILILLIEIINYLL